MTKVNQNGQLEWTFEELDLEGALELVRNEIEELNTKLDRYVDAVQLIQSTMINYTNDPVYRKLYDTQMNIYYKWSKLREVRTNLNILIFGGSK